MAKYFRAAFLRKGHGNCGRAGIAKWQAQLVLCLFKTVHHLYDSLCRMPPPNSDLQDKEREEFEKGKALKSSGTYGLQGE